MHIENQENLEAVVQLEEAKKILTDAIPQPTFLQGRVEFYNGSDRSSLQLRQIHRVRELQEINDNLQRQVRENEISLPTSSDPLSVIAQIEQCNILISRNTGEILNIHIQNERRLHRIAQLEAQNIDLQQEISDNQSKFSACQEIVARSQHASDFFLARAQYEKNLNEIRHLSQE